MKLKYLLFRVLFCLPFIAIVFYVQSYHGELVNNAKAAWQYLQNAEGNVYLAIDVYSPSGIKIDGIFSRGRNITGSWQLVNYPDWYKGRENFKKLSEFQGVLHPYLPYNKDFNILYTNGWYTFLYEWRPKKPIPMPPEASIRIKYQNVSTQNHYTAEHVLGIKVVSEIIKNKIDRPAIFWQTLYPASAAYKYSLNDRLRIVLNNLVAIPDSSEYTLEDLSNAKYSIYIEGKDGDSLDLLIGFVKRDSEAVYQVYSKVNELEENRNIGTGFNEILRHLAAIIFMAYFAIICWFSGLKFVKWRGIVLDSYAAKTVIPIFLGIILLTYLFFIIGILQLLYFPLIFVILLTILFFGFEPNSAILSTLKNILANELAALKQRPWRIVFWVLLSGMLLYNLSYCFVPAAYPDGSGDIVTSYLPIINDYIISHSFNAPIYNSTIGIIPQAVDVLRTVAKMFIGESGVYLLSFVYLLLILGTIYLITSDIFKVNNSLIYLAILLLLSGYVFTEFIHFGKHHIAILSFLLISLYSIRFFDNNKNYILIAIFLIFLVSSPFFYLILVALTFYLFIFGYSFYEYKTIKAPIFRLHMKSLIIFFIFCSIFYLKLIFDVGICYPPWILPASVSDFFLKINYNNGFFKYIDNNYIRHYYEFSHLTLSKNNLKYLKLLYENLNFYPILLFFPFLFKKTDRYKNLYIIETIVIVCLLMIPYIYSDKSARLVVYYIYPLIILQFGIINDIMLSFKQTINGLLKKRFFYLEAAFILLILSYLIFEGSPASFKIRKLRFIDNQAWRWVGEDYRALLYNNVFYNSPKKWFFREILPVFLGKKSKYMYLKAGYPFPTPDRNFDHCMLIRQYTNTKDTILIVPVRFHSYAMRHITARHALGSVIYQRDINNIMSDLKKLSIGYLSYIPMHYHDYNPFYTPIFEDGVFYKYFKLLFRDNGSSFYKIIYDGTNKEYSPSPYDVKGLPFIPMQETEDKI